MKNSGMKTFKEIVCEGCLLRCDRHWCHLNNGVPTAMFSNAMESQTLCGHC